MKGFAAALSLAMLAAAQEPQPPRATFKSNIDLVPVDVSVVDRDGRPVTELSAEDFTLTVDGKPRRIASAQFVSVDRATESAPPKPREYASNAGATGGRLVMIAVDSNNIGVGRGKSAIEAARRFVGTLNRSDRVALVTLPTAGPQIEFTSNHAVVQTMLGNVVGQATENLGQKRVGLTEALAIERNDSVVINEVTSRECPWSNNSAPAVLASCLQQLSAESRQMLAQVQQRTNNALISLRSLFDRMASDDTPKTLILISEGLLLEREYNDAAWVEGRAAAAHVTLFALHLDTPEADASANRVSPSRGQDREVLRDGLDRLVGMAKGEVFRVAGNADFVFRRLGLELSGYYLLSFEPQPGDRDGKAHKISVDLRRKGLTMRSRREFSVGAATRSTAEVVVEALRAPLLATDIPVKLTTYTFQDPDSSKLKILVAADIDRSLSPEGDLSVGYLMFDDKGNLVASQLDRLVGSPIDPTRRTQSYLGAALAPPGFYTLKLAVADDAGRRGSVERAFPARINGFGQLHVTDLVIADNSLRGARGLPPAVDADFEGGSIHGYLELFSDVPEQLQNATVVMEVAQGETSAALDSTPARFLQGQPGADKRRVAEAGVPIALLPPGEYMARAVISVSGRKVGQVVRPFRVTRAAATVSAPGAGAVPMRPAAAPIAFTSKTDAFDKSAVLTPQVVGFFLDRMSAAAAANAASVRPAIDSVRAGRFDDARQALTGTGDDQLAAVFLKGVVLLSSGNLEGAAVKFRDALRQDPLFFSAAFYLGATYAAGGKDRDAAGAWQASLITESDAPFVYTLLGDALLRLRDLDQAIDVLTDARTLWPADDTVTIRLATALVLANKPVEGLKVLQPYLAGHPDDQERLFLAMRALFEARSAGRVVESAEADTALFVKYAGGYAGTKGPQQALVDQWRKYLESRR